MISRVDKHIFKIWKSGHEVRNNTICENEKLLLFNTAYSLKLIDIYFSEDDDGSFMNIS